VSLIRNLLAIATVAAWALACGGGKGENGGEEAGESAAPAAATLPVSEPTGAVDEALAERGEQLFQSKGCNACHTIGGGRLTGPDLGGVTERRSFEWIYHQISNPDSMTTHDPTARQLMAEYMTQMPNLGLQPEDTKALYEYLRERNEELQEAEESD
jgi:cytochrome c